MAASAESEVCFECGEKVVDENFENCGGCVCKFHSECLRQFGENNMVVCTQCFELLSSELPKSVEVTPNNQKIPDNDEYLLRAPKTKAVHKGIAEDSFSKDLTLFKLHLLEEEQKLAKRRQQEKEVRRREINAHKEQQVRRLQAMRDEEIRRKEQDEAECIARMEEMELIFQQEQHEQDMEFLKRKSELLGSAGVDINVSSPSVTAPPPVSETNRDAFKKVPSIPCDNIKNGKNPIPNSNRINCPAKNHNRNMDPQEPSNKRNSEEHLHHLTSSHLAARKGLNNSLPKFAGRPRDWPYFLKKFESSTKLCNFDDVENVDRLKEALHGPALSAVSGLLLHDHNVPVIMQKLQTFFGQPKYIINDLVSELREEKNIRSDNLRSLLQFANKVSNLVATLQSAEASNHLWSPYLIDDMIEKLPLQLQREWAHHRQAYEEVNLEIFSMWLNNEAEMLTSISPKSLLFNDFDKKKNNEYVNIHDDSSPKGCYMCSSNCPDLSQCSEFKSLAYNKRMELVSKKFLCRSCLKRCKKRCNKVTCGINGCNYYHHELLHKADQNVPSKEVKEVQINTHVGRSEKTWFKVVPVILHKGNRSIKTLALLDGAATISLIEKGLSDALQLQGTPQELCIKWTNGTHYSVTDSKRVFLEISTCENSSKHIILNDVRTVHTLDLPKQHLTKNMVERYDHLRGIPFVPYDEGKPQLLIGLDNARLMTSTRRRVGHSADPIAEKTELGWIISGGSDSLCDRSVYHVSKCKEDDNLNDTLKQFIAIDTLGTSPITKQLISKEDARALAIMEKDCIRVSGRYEVPLLWKFDVFSCPNNYDSALKRLICLEKKMEKDPVLGKAVDEMINDYLRKGYAKEVSLKNEASKEDGWFLPIFVVRNHNKPKKLRIVWDAAAKFRNVALNSLILKGPDLTANIMNVLFRFQEKQVAISGDIKEMYHQVGIKEQDRKYLRFLYRRFPTDQPKVLEMQVMVFGSTCSGFCAQYVLNKNAERFQDKFPDAVESIRLSHYVDDLLDSADTEQEALGLAEQIRQIHGDGGFQIRNWLSNSQTVMQGLNGVSSMDQKSISLADDDREKVLGMWWKPRSDEFTFSLKYNKTSEAVLKGETIPTKREVLKLIMSVFDPLGLLNHLLTFPKILMQDIWRSNINWDDRIKEDHFSLWTDWLKELPKIESLNIPRSYFLQKVTEIEMHTFVDASEEAYAACVYFRAVVNDTVQCRLVTSKSRVAPIRSCSIPRLELQSALLGARLSSRVKDLHRFQVVRKVYWSDSRTVLAWIRSDHRRFHQYVACRVGEIIELSNIEEWRWVPTSLNISDKATRKVVPEITSDDSWFTGPNFLYHDEEMWPVEHNRDLEVKEELRPSFVHFVNFHHVSYEAERFSNWSRLLRSQAFLLRFIFNIKAACNKSNGKSGLLSSEEYKNAEKILIIQAQMEGYEDEYVLLRKNEKISKSSCLYKYSPFIDNDGVIRCDSRLDVESLPQCFRKPCILPSSHRITYLILGNFHKMYLHRNFETVVNEVNQRYIVPSLRSSLKAVRRNCQRCRILDATPQTPKMSALPLERLSPFFRPFTFTGIDFFGPMLVVVGRHHEKRWGVVLTCLNTRAVHIEIAFSMSTDSCILVIKRFINRRGCPQKLFSDNGTNLRGASNELKEAVEKIDKVRLAENFISQSTEWSFIPPSAPHMGGAWERMVRSIKTAINFALPQRVPNDELLMSMMSEAENIINSRPLTFVPLDNEASEALSPNHFLLGSSNGIKSTVDVNPDGEFLRKSWHRLEVFGHKCWKKWLQTYIPSLVRREKWNEDVPNLSVGDIVFILDDNAPKNEYKRGRILETTASRDGRVRKATVQASGRIYVRPVCKLAKIDVAIDDGKDYGNSLPGGAVDESDNLLQLESE